MRRPGWQEDFNTFAMALSLASESIALPRVFRVLGGAYTPWPWKYMSQPEKMYARAGATPEPHPAHRSSLTYPGLPDDSARHPVEPGRRRPHLPGGSARLVDLLSHHLYSSPRVYLRELLQNAVDALTARHGLEPGAPADAFGIRLYADGSVVRVEDDGVGLTEDDVHTFLATIGRSSKRAERIAEQRADFIGQFGIGLLSCFLVADEIHVLSRSARTPDAPSWNGGPR